MIARIVVAVALALLVAAPGHALAGSMQIEVVEEAAFHADDEAVTQLASAPAAVRDGDVRPARSDDVVPPGPALDRIFRPPRRPPRSGGPRSHRFRPRRTPLARVLESSSGRAP